MTISYFSDNGENRQSSVNAAIFLNGLFIAAIGAFQLIPLLVELNFGQEWQAFALSIMIAIAIGGGLMLSFPIKPTSLDIHTVFVFTITAWLMLSIIGGLPFIFSSLQLSLTDAFFESMSGITTTGATVITGLDDVSPGILIWRAMLQWIGGIGIIMTAIALLPGLGIGGMQLFLSQQLGSDERVHSKASHIAIGVITVYLTITILCAISYDAVGMSVLDAWTHAFSTVSSGGFSTHDASAGHFNSALVYWVMIIFMILSCLPYGAYVLALYSNPKELINDEQVRGFIVITVVLTFLLWGVLQLIQPEKFVSSTDVVDGFTLTAFSVVSIITTSGFAVVDYSLWGAFASVSFFIIGFLGACAGSGSCALKTFRLQIMAKTWWRQLRLLRSPHAIITLRYNGILVEDKAIRGIFHYVFLFLLTAALGALMLGTLGLDSLTAISGATAALTNVGPGLGPIIGPAGTYSSLPDSAKWILFVLMLLGRLELVTLLLLFTPAFWRR